VWIVFLIQSQHFSLLNISPQSGAVYRFEWCLFSFSTLWPANGCHGRCWLWGVVCGWAKQVCGWLGKGRAASGLALACFVLGGDLWVRIRSPHLTPHRDPCRGASGPTHLLCWICYQTQLY